MAKSFGKELGWVSVVALVVLAAMAGTAAEETKPKEKAEAEKAKAVNPYLQASKDRGGQGKEAPKVYTTEDLRKMAGGEAAPAETPAEGGQPGAEKPKTPAEKPQDPLAWVEQRKAAAAERQKAIAEAEANVVAAQKRVADLEKRELQGRNPYMARPELSEDEKKELEGKAGSERRNITLQKLEQAREELAAAEAELNRLRRAR